MSDPVVDMIASMLESKLRASFPLESGVATAAEDAAKIVVRMVEMVIKAGAPLDPDVWFRAMEASASEFASEELARQWLAAGNVLVNRVQGK